MTPDDPPNTLLVLHDLDTVRVKLGPSQRMLAWKGLVVAIAAGAAGGALVLGGELVVGGLISMVGMTAGTTARIRGWVHREAPLELRLHPHGVALRRVYRQRLLHEETLGYDALVSCETLPRGLRLVLASGEERVLVAGFRSQDELRWVAQRLQERIEHHEGTPDPRLLAVRGAAQ